MEEVRDADFAAAVADCAGDVSWLLERARTTRKTEAIETRWKNRDGRQLVVRLQAFAATTGSIEVVAEDVTAAADTGVADVTVAVASEEAAATSQPIVA